MTLRDDLEMLIPYASRVENTDIDTHAHVFLRDHGQALLEAVKDRDRLDFIDGYADEGVISLGYKDEEGIYLKASPVGGTKLKVVGMNCVRKAIDAAMEGEG